MTSFEEQLSRAVRNDEIARMAKSRDEFVIAFNKVFGFFPEVEGFEKRGNKDLFKVAGVWMISSMGALYAKGVLIRRPADMMTVYTQESDNE